MATMATAQRGQRPQMPKLTYRSSTALMTHGLTDSISSAGTDQSYLSKSTNTTVPLTDNPSPDGVVHEIEVVADSKKESKPASRDPRPSSVRAKPKPTKKKSSAIMGFFATKEPSAAALASFEEYTRKQAAAAGKGDRNNGGALPGVSSAKMPPSVPPVNSKWDGIPKALKEKERDKGKARERTMPRMSSATQSRARSNSRPSTGKSNGSSEVQRPSSRSLKSSKTDKPQPTSTAPSSINSESSDSKPSDRPKQRPKSIPLPMKLADNAQSLEHFPTPPQPPQPPQPSQPLQPSEPPEPPKPAVVDTHNHRDSYFFPPTEGTLERLPRNSVDSVTLDPESLSLLLDEFPPTPMSIGSPKCSQPDLRRNNSLVSPPATPPAVVEEPALQKEETRDRPTSAKTRPRRKSRSNSTRSGRPPVYTLIPSTVNLPRQMPPTSTIYTPNQSPQITPNLSSTSLHSNPNGKPSSSRKIAKGFGSIDSVYSDTSYGLGITSPNTEIPKTNTEAVQLPDKSIAPWEEPENVESQQPPVQPSNASNLKRKKSKMGILK